MKSQKEIEESFHAGQTRILEMVASDAPLPEILKSVVLLMEAQADGMLCSILLLGADGIHIRHGAAPGLPDEVRQSSKWRSDRSAHRLLWDGDVSA